MPTYCMKWGSFLKRITRDCFHSIILLCTEGVGIKESGGINFQCLIATLIKYGWALEQSSSNNFPKIGSEIDNISTFVMNMWKH